MSGPAESDIEAFMAITNAPREHAISFLKSNNLDSNRAINAYYENPDAVLNAPPDASQEQQQQSHNAHLQDQPAVDKVSDVTTGVSHPAYDAPQSWALVPAERANANWSGPLPPPAGGSPSYPQQGQQHTRRGSDAKRLLAREEGRLPRQEGAPVGIRPIVSRNGVNYLPGYLTILHAIPIARKAFLTADADWNHYQSAWDGEGGGPFRPGDAMSFGRTLLSEMRLLMARLSQSTRAFVSIGQLEDSTTFSSSSFSVERFLDQWETTALPMPTQRLSDMDGEADADTVTNLFSSRAIKLHSMWDQNTQRQQQSGFQRGVSLVECELLPPDNSSPLLPNVNEPQDLYDILDHTIWPDDDFPPVGVSSADDGGIEETFIDRPARIFSIRVQTQDPLKGGNCSVKAPATLYLDRYLSENREWAMNFRRQRESTAKEVKALDESLQRCTGNRNDPHAAATRSATSQVLQNAVNALATLAGQKEDNGEDDDNTPIFKASETTQRTATQLASDLDSLSSRIDEKVKNLEERRDSLSRALKRHAYQLTARTAAYEDQPDTSNLIPRAKYHLSGVCMPRYTTYLLRRTRESSDDTNDANSQTLQWWRISFDLDASPASQSSPQPWDAIDTTPSYAAPSWWAPPPPNDSDDDDTAENERNKPEYTQGVYQVRRVREVDVVKAVHQEAVGSMLLVYASEDAMSTKYGIGEDDSESLSEDLKKYMDLYNREFQQGLENQRRQDTQKQPWETAPVPDQPASSVTTTEHSHPPVNGQSNLRTIEAMDIDSGNDNPSGVDSGATKDRLEIFHEQQQRSSTLRDNDRLVDGSRPPSSPSTAVQGSPARQGFDSWEQSAEASNRGGRGGGGDFGKQQHAESGQPALPAQGNLIDLDDDDDDDDEGEKTSTSRAVYEGPNQRELAEEDKTRQKENAKSEEGQTQEQEQQRHSRKQEAKGDEHNGNGIGNHDDNDNDINDSDDGVSIGNANGNGNGIDNGHEHDLDMGNGNGNDDERDAKDREKVQATGSTRSLKKILKKLL